MPGMRRKAGPVEKKRKNVGDSRQWLRYHFFGTAMVSVSREKKEISTTIANISMSGIGVYSPLQVGRGKRVKVTISFIDAKGKTRVDEVAGMVDWQKKFQEIYLIGIRFDEELNLNSQPKLLEHLTWLIEAYELPQPFKDKRIAIL